ncbi:MAG: repressor LexA [Candidatus Gastranaerophilales bacterium]|nr:repressor LexA [Candidatus Gastranaerophilales bacterium]
MENLTLKQQQFFENLKSIYANRALPSYNKIADLLGYKSKNSVKQYIEILKREGLIETIDNFLYIKSEKIGANLVSGYVRAGFAGIMDDKIEKRISLDKLLDINSPSTFVFKVSGDSMTDIGILDGDYVVIKKTSEANIGDIVLAIIDNEFTLKVYKKDSKGAYLEPQNPDYPILRPKFSLNIFGVALGITRKIL